MNVPQEILGELAGKLGTHASVRNVFGEPVRVEDRTIIPVARIGFGLGAGGGGMTPERTGGGGGGGGGALPVGVVEVSPEGTRFIPFSGSKRLTAAVGLAILAGFAIGHFSRRK